MRKWIFDVGSGASLPNKQAVIDTVDALEPVLEHKKRHQDLEIIIKTQLFRDIPPNTPLDREIFLWLKDYGEKKGFQVTSSVFDIESLAFLLAHDPCLVKIACRPDLYWLVGEVPRKIPTLVSYDRRDHTSLNNIPRKTDYTLACVPTYPANIKDYFIGNGLWISDHTVGLELFKRTNPAIWEKHFVLKKNDPNNPDSMGGFALDPEELKQI